MDKTKVLYEVYWDIYVKKNISFKNKHGSNIVSLKTLLFFKKNN